MGKEDGLPLHKKLLKQVFGEVMVFPDPGGSGVYATSTDNYVDGKPPDWKRVGHDGISLQGSVSESGDN